MTGSMKRPSWNVSRSGKRTHIRAAALRLVDHTLHQEAVPEEPLISTRPQWSSGGFALPLKSVGQIPPVAEPQPGAFQAMLYELDELSFDRVVE